IRFLKEDPWQRIREVSRLIRRTPLNAWVRGQSLWTFEIFANDVVELAMERLAANGMREIALYDQANDLANVEVAAAQAKSVGIRVRGALVFSWSPVHTDAYYAEKAAEFVRIGANEIIIKDPSGMLSVERVATLIAEMRRKIGKVRINVHTHCMTGRAPQVLLAAAKAGADTLHTAISPLAHAASHPPTEWVHDELAKLGVDTGLDRPLLDEIAGYFRYVCRRWDKPEGRPVDFDPFTLEHQMPGGMISNLITQLRANGIGHRLDEILRESAVVRKDLGYAPVVSPTAQLMVTQATLNVVQGERYKVIPDELRKYVLGHYGKPAAPFNPELVDRVLAMGGKQVSGRAGDLVPPALARLRRTRGPFKSDDDLLLAAMYSDAILGPMVAARAQSDYSVFDAGFNPLRHLLEEIERQPDLHYFRLAKGGDMNVELTR
ncbi:MAG: carboxylase, partial [Alphaproteobacteria bacterium]|nr:carboxylase [Alphaproteobacteria bacterium]